MRSFDAIIFDLGGTLIYFDSNWPEVLQQADHALYDSLYTAGIQLPKDSFLSQFRRQIDEYYRQRETEFIEYTTLYVLRIILAEWGYPDASDSILRPALAAMYQITQECWQIEQDALPTLTALKEAGYQLGIISNASDDADVQALVDKVRIRPFFDFVLTSASLGVRKPNPKIFQAGLNHWVVPANRALMVGDTLGADILGAQLSGMAGIWITRWADTPANRAHADTIYPDARITTLVELPGLLENIDHRAID